MAETTYGRSSSLKHDDIGNIVSGEMRGCTYNRTNDHLWAHTANARVNDNGSNSAIRIGIYNVNSSRHPTTRRAYSESIAVTSATEGNVSGSIATIDVAAPSGVTFTAIPLQDNTRYHLAILNVGALIDHAMEQASDISADNESFYYRTGLSQPPPSSFGSYSSSNEGHMTTWLNAQINEAPNAPTNLSPSGTINDTAPTFAADFTDTNSGYGDYLNQMRVQVRRVSDSTVFWDTTLTSTQAERTGAAMSRAYGGTTLVRGTAYEWRTQHSDHFGEWGDWTAWTTFTPAELGFIVCEDDPTGKIEDNTPDFDGTWSHDDSDDMTVVQVRILSSGGTVLQTGSEYDITDVTTATADFTVAWADTGLSTLAWGTSYQYQMRGKDETATWSDWSAAATFSTNAAPTVPTNLTPANSQILTDYPLLMWQSTDADDTTATGLVSKCRIKDNTGSVLFTRSGTYDATLFGGAGGWRYQTDGTDLATYATYRWDAYSGDGTLWSGEVAHASEASAVKSAEAIFAYAEGPTVTITDPTEDEAVTTANLTVTWTTTDQQKYRVYLYEDGTTNLVYDSGETVSGTSSHVIPSGYYFNGDALDLVVWVEDSDQLEGQSAIRSFTVDYVEPDSIANFQAIAEYVGTDLWASAIRLTWDQTELGVEDGWQEYTIRRTAASGNDATTIILTRLTSPTQTSYTDFAPASGVEYTYSISQTILTGLDELTSAGVEASAEIMLGGVVLVAVANPEVVRTNLKYTNERDHTRNTDEQVYQPLSGLAPTTVRSRQYTKRAAFDAKLFADAQATADARRLELEMCDQYRGTFCYRDDKGRKYFCTLPDITISDRVADWYVAAIEVREELYSEGVE